MPWNFWWFSSTSKKADKKSKKKRTNKLSVSSSSFISSKTRNSIIKKSFSRRRHRLLFDKKSTKHSISMTTADLFQPVMAKCINQLIHKKHKNTTIHDIQEKLVNRYPRHAKKVTKEAIMSCIQNQYPKLTGLLTTSSESVEKKKKKKKLQQKAEEEERLLIEDEESIFIDERMITLKVKKEEQDVTTDSEGEISSSSSSSFSFSSAEYDENDDIELDEEEIMTQPVVKKKKKANYTRRQQQQQQASTTNTLDVHLMCAISSQGLEKLLVSLSTCRHSHTDFMRCLFHTLPPQIPFQIIVKSNLQQEIQQALFSGRRYALHTLYAFPNSRLNPVQKYIFKLTHQCLSKELPSTVKAEQDVVEVFKEATKDVSKEDCQKWIRDYLNHC